MSLGYNPMRISAPRGLFQPITEREAQFYVASSQNPLRTQPPPSPTLFSGAQPRARRPQPVEEPPSPISYHPPSPILIEPVRPAAADPGHHNVTRGKKRTVEDAQLPDREDRRKGAGQEGEVNGDTVTVDGVRVDKASLVAEHYNARPNTDVAARSESRIIALRSFNNWVKSVLIGKFAAGNSPARRHPSDPHAPRGIKVLDMGCGKGGDLMKWDKAGVQDYFGLDIASVSIEQARQRYSSMNRPRFLALFETADCFQRPLAELLAEHNLIRPFDVVTMQFCMHYAFETESKARTMLENVSSHLDHGGTFIGTIPNDEKLLQLLDSIPPEETVLEAGNSYFRVTFDSRKPFEAGDVYGVKYRFFLFDAVDDVPEYVVYWDHFVALAAQYGLELVYRDEFHFLYMKNQDDPQFSHLLRKMKVVDADGSSQMDPDQWDAANLYIAFAFRKL